MSPICKTQQQQKNQNDYEGIIELGTCARTTKFRLLNVHRRHPHTTTTRSTYKLQQNLHPLSAITYIHLEQCPTTMLTPSPRITTASTMSSPFNVGTYLLPAWLPYPSIHDPRLQLRGRAHCSGNISLNCTKQSIVDFHSMCHPSTSACPNWARSQ